MDYVRMRAFDSGKDAKEYLISQIVLAARTVGTSLSETERKMMYFTASAWAPPGMWEVNEAFERSYDTPTYEAKIARLAAIAREHVSDSGEIQMWVEAVQVLRREDHYLLVLIAASSSSYSRTELKDRTKLVGTALLIVLLILVGIVLFSSRS